MTSRWETPVAAFDVVVGDSGVSSVALSNGTHNAALDAELKSVLDDHMAGYPAALKLDLQGLTPMAQVTLAKLLEIPFGEVRSYSWVAREIGRPTAVRPVASAIANNPIPVLIPCHRVIRSDGFVGEYSLGTELKTMLLEYEKLDVEHIESLARRNIRFVGNPADQTFHLPSCRKVPLDSTLEFKTADEALEAKLRPCSSCRPVVVADVD